jgi:hypothetical protein
VCPLRDQHLVILQRFSTALRHIVPGVENDAVRTEMRIEGARDFMFEHGGDDVSCRVVGIGEVALSISEVGLCFLRPIAHEKTPTARRLPHEF